MWGGFQLTIDGSLSSSGGAAKPALSLSKGAVRRGRQPALDEPSPSAAERRTLLYRPLRITARLGVRVRYGLITSAIAEQPNSGLSGILPSGLAALLNSIPRNSLPASTRVTKGFPITSGAVNFQISPVFVLRSRSPFCKITCTHSRSTFPVRERTEDTICDAFVGPSLSQWA